MSSTLQSGVRFRAYPDAGLASMLAQWIGCQRVIYNAKVAEDRYHWKHYCRSLALTGDKPPIDQQYSHFKNRELTPWLFAAPSQVLRNGAVRWMTAKQRHLKGLAKAPTTKRADGRQTVLLTSELFWFIPDASGALVLQVGTAKNPVGLLPFHAHRPWKVPKQIVVGREAGKWSVSFSFEVESGIIQRTPGELAYELNLLDDAELEASAIGCDRGIVQNLADSTGRFYTPPATCEARKARKDRYVRRMQRKLARQQKGSKRRDRTKLKIAVARQYGADCRRDFAHKVSYQLVEAPFRLYVFEALKIQKMLRRPKAKTDAQGRYIRNGAAAKAGLHRSIQASAWGAIGSYTKYKAAQRNKLVVTVPPQYTSQECSHCGHIHPDNRVTQALFVCQHCGHSENADTNAARVIKMRGIQALRAGISQKTVKRVAFRKKNSAVPGPGTDSKLVERT
ncbi:RNA-guided endonuclease InsQ/TnpB family protein [Paraburkholderia mimosarum]|uniref:RNA-guided endonuclease InsQ/TnpB family protein n=1 Tax=Paraburkholderia mimosarum TaxID=312026 RepID=UPI0039C02DA1